MKMFACLMSSRRIVGASLALLGMMLLGAPQGVQAQECDTSLLLLNLTGQDSVSYFGVGEANSRSRSLAQSQAMALARARLVLSAQADVIAFEQLAQQTLGERVEAIANAFKLYSEAFVAVRLTNTQVEASSFCAERGGWTFIIALKIDQVNVAEEAVEAAQEAMENSIENGDAEYSRTQTDRIFSEVDNMLEERRRRRGGQDG